VLRARERLAGVTVAAKVVVVVEALEDLVVARRERLGEISRDQPRSAEISRDSDLEETSWWWSTNHASGEMYGASIAATDSPCA